LGGYFTFTIWDMGFRTSTDWLTEEIVRCFTGLSLPPPPKTFVTDRETYWINIYDILIIATPLWPSVGVKPNTPKVGDLESFGTPECLVFDSKAKNTLHLGVFGVVGKVLNSRYRKWPRIGHLDICRPSYGQKKGRESNWQFDSRPLKVRNRPLPDLWIESATRRWKDLDEGYNFDSDLVRSDSTVESYELPKSRDSNRDNFGTISGLQLGSPEKNSHLDVGSAEWCREYYMGEGGGFPRMRAVMSLMCQSARGLSQHPRVSWMWTNPLVVGSWMQIQAWSSSPSS
jgi:hypothetical protein